MTRKTEKIGHTITENFISLEHDVATLSNQEKSGKQIVILFSSINVFQQDKQYLIYKKIIHDFIFQENIPKSIIFMNNGIQLLKNSDILKILNELQKMGIEIIYCKESSLHNQIEIKDAALKKASIHDINSILFSADLVISY